MNLRPLSLAAWLALLVSTQTLAQSGAGGEYPITDFLSADVLKTLGDTVAPKASLFDARATYVVNGDEGSAGIVGTMRMLERVNELRAIQTLEAMKKTDVYIDAVENSAKAPVAYGKALVDEPVDTIADSARGLGGFFADVGYSIVSDDPSQDNVAKTGLGQSAAKRAFAFQLGVNPYSSYTPLQEALSDVAWTAVGGGLTVGAAFRAVQNSPGQVLRLSRVANTGRELVRDKSPRELQNRNEAALKEMGVGDALSETFLNNTNYDPEAETRLVVALEALKGVEGRPDVVSRAALISSTTRAQEMRDWIELIVSFHEQVIPARKLVVIAGAVWVIDNKNIAHGIFPTDYIVPTPNLANYLGSVSQAVKSSGYRLGQVYATGAIHPEALKILEGDGWTRVQAHAETILRDS